MSTQSTNSKGTSQWWTVQQKTEQIGIGSQQLPVTNLHELSYFVFDQYNTEIKACYK